MPQSLLCPRCKSTVIVDDDAGGTWVECPHCQQTFLVPGLPSAGDADDDDWLSLSEPIAPKPAKPFNSAAKPSAGNDSSTLPDVGNDDLFAGDLPPLAPLKPRASTPTSLDDWEMPPAPASTVPKKSATPASPEFESEFKVRCPVCGSPSDVTAKQSGKQIRCHDCHTMIQVPPPPRKKLKVSIDLATAETFAFNPSSSVRDDRPADPFRRSAEELLAKAERVEEESPPPNFDAPKINEWFRSVFGIFTQIGVVAHWIILSILAASLGFIALASGVQILHMALFPAGVFFAAMVLACAFAIMQSIANDEESVTEWPLTLEPMEWLAPMMFCFAATGLSIGPGWFLGHAAFGESLATVFLVMASVFLVFPFILLSMLDMQNILMPFSPEVGRSVTRCEEAWGGFYFSSLLLFAATFLWFVFAAQATPPFTAAMSMPIAVGATFVYFAMLGRLAYAIGQSVNEAPNSNDIDSVRQAERDRAKSGG